MVQRISRLAVVALLAAAAVYAGDPKCDVSARQCDQQIRNMLSGKRYHGLMVDERNPVGLVVKEVADKSPAWRAGVRRGDRLIAANGKSLTHATKRDFKQIVAEAREQGRLSVIVWRGSGYQRLDIRLEPYTKEQMDKIVAGHLAATHQSAAGSH